MKIARSLALTLSIASGAAFPAALIGAALVASDACAQQVKSVDAYWAVVERQAIMHAGDSQRYYRVAELQPGTVVRVDGESAEWARVSYPKGLGAFVRAESVRQGEQPEALVLTSSSRLYAANAVAGFDGSWKALLSESQALPAGTTLTALETVRNPAGAVVGYKVAAPESARGYILRTNLRTPTPDELRAAGVDGASTEGTPTTSQPTTQPEPGTTTDTNAQPTTPEVIDLTQPLEGPGTPPPVTTPDAAPTEDQSAADHSGEGPVTIDQRPAQPATPAPAPAGSLQALDEAFRRVQSQSDADAEIDELKAELEAALARTEDTPGNRMIRAGLLQRIEILRLRAEWRDRMRAIEERRIAADATLSTAQKNLTSLEQSRVYTITGRLVTSELYDGVRLPRMLRVQSIGGATTRTLGYIRPTPELNLDGKIGQTVGVVGNIILDPRTGLRTIEATRVDAISGTQGNVATPRGE